MSARSSWVRAALLVLSSVCALGLVGSACAPDDNPPNLVNQPPPEKDPCADFKCVVTSPGCEAARIHANDASSTCATCVLDGNDVDVCGDNEVARCEARETSSGTACHLCVVDGTGEILFDDCDTGEPTTPAVRCETAPATVNNPPVDAPELACESCVDDRGVTVSVTCEPVHDHCDVVEVGGRNCRVCTLSGDEVFRTCEQPSIAPTSCVAYASQAGRCIDCVGDNNVLLSHECTLADGAPVAACHETVQQDDVRCWVCADANGTPFERNCQSALPAGQSCERLSYSEQTCVVCVDTDNNINLSTCQRNDCNDDSNPNCAPPPPCTFELNDNGQVCRTCPVEATGALEQRCVGNGGLTCDAVPEDLVDPTHSQGRVCIVCEAQGTNVIVYQDCDSNAGTPPPYCVLDDGPHGGICSTCFDADSGDLLYRRCGADTCYRAGHFAIVGDDGQPAQVDGARATTSCQVCDHVGGSNTTCALEPPCVLALGETDNNTCPDDQELQIQPRACSNPWDAAAPDPSIDDANRLLAWALVEHGIALVSVTRQVQDHAPISHVCTDARGDTLHIRVRPDDVDAMRTLLGIP